MALAVGECLIAPNAAEVTFSQPVDAWNDSRIIAQVEKTKRTRTEAMRGVDIQKISAHRDVLVRYLEEVFRERSQVNRHVGDSRQGHRGRKQRDIRTIYLNIKRNGSLSVIRNRTIDQA